MMIRKALTLTLASALTLGIATSAHAVQIVEGVLSMDINPANGNMDEIRLSGNPYYDLGIPVSDWGIQTGADTGTFTLSTNRSSANPFGMTTVIGPTSASATGAYTTGGASVDLVRSFAHLGGIAQDAILITTSLTNTASTPITLRLFSTYDPDQGPGSSTINDIAFIGSSTVAVHENGGLAGAVGDLPPPPASAVGFSGGFGLSISSGVELNNFFAGSGIDPDGALADIGFALGWEFTLAASGGSITLQELHCYGTSSAAAKDCFADIAVPEPATVTLLGLALVGLGAIARRRRG